MSPGAVRAKALSDAATALEQRSAEITSLVVREVGKPVSEARGEVARGVAILRYYAQAALLPDGETIPAAAADQLLMARHVPVGVAALLTPWNFPVAIPLWKAAPSLAYGNATMLKPSSAAAATALALAEILGGCLPPDVFQVVLGGAAAAGPLIDHPDVAAVSFTGSSEVGTADQPPRSRPRLPGAGRDGRPEPVDRAGRRRPGPGRDRDRLRAMGYAGQKCTATSRVIVERRGLPAVPRPAGGGDRAHCRYSTRPTTRRWWARSSTHGSRAAALAAVADSGGRVITGGAALDAPGYYLAPTLVELDQPAGPLATEEVFAPVAALIRAKSADEAVSIANAVRYGLVAAVFTSDLGGALRLTRQLEAGMIRVNAPTSGVDFQAPFGGAKESSYGPREQGHGRARLLHRVAHRAHRSLIPARWPAFPHNRRGSGTSASRRAPDQQRQGAQTLSAPAGPACPAAGLRFVRAATRTAARAGMAPQMAMPARAPKWLVRAPMSGAPIGVPPMKASMYRPMTRPRSSGSTASWTEAFAMDWNARLRNPMATSSVRKTAMPRRECRSRLGEPERCRRRSREPGGSGARPRRPAARRTQSRSPERC